MLPMTRNRGEPDEQIAMLNVREEVVIMGTAAGISVENPAHDRQRDAGNVCADAARPGKPGPVRVQRRGRQRTRFTECRTRYHM